MTLLQNNKVGKITVSPTVNLSGLEQNKRQKIVSGGILRLVQFFLMLSRLKMIFRYSKNPAEGIRILKKLLSMKKDLIGSNRSKKMTLVEGKYRWALYAPGWPSKIWQNFFKGEMNRLTPLPGKNNRFINVFIAITKKCSLQCEHCFEWDALNGKERLSLDEIKTMVQRFSDKGVSQIQLTGGEPMLRIQDMLEIVRTGPEDVEFWVLTSGLNFTDDNAAKLKAAGLTGVVVSLDHYDPEIHNLFRGTKKAFEWAQEAIKNANKHNLVTAISICVTRAFVTNENLMTYAKLAKEMGVSFIQILEPKAVGHYEGKDVGLLPEHEKILDAFYLKMNYDKAFSQYPIIAYHGFYQRRMGCLSSGVRSLYVDTNGDMHACPFCRKTSGSALGDDFDENLDALALKGCSGFKSFRT